MTQHLLEALAAKYSIGRVDTSRGSGIRTIGLFRVRSARTAVRHGIEFAIEMLRWRPDVVYVPLAQNTWGVARDLLFLIEAHLVRRPLIVHFHGSGLPAFLESGPAPMVRLLRASIGERAMGIALHQKNARELAALFPRARIVVIPNGVASHQLPAAPPDARQGDKVLYIGAHLAEKGVLDLLSAAAAMPDDLKHVRFVFAGEWSRAARDRPTAERLVREFDMGERVTFLGPVGPDERKTLLNSCDVFAFCPRWQEGHPLVVIEAMSAGLPVVVTRSGALEDTVIDGYSGLFAEAGDPVSIAEQLARLLRDDEGRRAMGVAARREWERRFTVDEWGRKMVAVFDSVCERTADE
jgi:glycosyltransferase involved in cell wall biosynthesis